MTLAIDVGGTGIKASVLDELGQMEHDRVRTPTPYPVSPQKLVTVVVDLIKPLPAFDRVSVGFPGMVRDGRILSAPHFVSPDGPGGVPLPKLVAAWESFDLESELARALGRPTKVANDADVQGSAVVAGRGLELVLTLGTGLGTALFHDGPPAAAFRVRPHAVPQGRHLQRSAGRGRSAEDRHQEVAAAGPRRGRNLPLPDLLRLVLHRRWQLRPNHRRSAGEGDPGRQPGRTSSAASNCGIGLSRRVSVT